MVSIVTYMWQINAEAMFAISFDMDVLFGYCSMVGICCFGQAANYCRKDALLTQILLCGHHYQHSMYNCVDVAHSP